MMFVEKGAIPSGEKEVEELARAMCPYSKDSLCRECSEACFYKDYAKRAIDKGWRKQSEGEWISKDGFQVCSNCDATKPIAFSTVLKITHYKCDYCHRCGAKMKGGVE